MVKASASALRDTLWDTLQKVRSGDMPPGTGTSVAQQAREILRTVRTQLSVLGQAGKSVTPELVEFAQS